MRLEGFSKKVVMGVGVLAKVCSKPIHSGTECVNVQEQRISNIASSYEMNSALDNINTLSAHIYEEQQDFYGSKYKLINDYGSVLNDERRSYAACVSKEEDSFYEDKKFQIESKNFISEVARSIVSVAALVSGMVFSKYILSYANISLNRLRLRNTVQNIAEDEVQNLEVLVMRQRIYSELSDNTLVVDDISESEVSEDTWLVEESESLEFEPMDS